MKVCVLGLWHLGSVTAACVASLGHEVVGWDADQSVVTGLQAGAPPIGEPGLPELVKRQQVAGMLSFTTDLPVALQGAEVVWVTYDTPVDDNDVADVNFVLGSVERAFPFLESGTLVMISSQLPVGSTRELERAWSLQANGRTLTFACSPENLRLGKAIDVFLSPDRIVVGVRGAADQRIVKLFGPLSGKILWMGVESAEMTKHAINAFLATSVTFINELAVLCEAVGADAGEVESGLKSEGRIGPKAYLGPGASFAGGTLARDVQFLRAIGTSNRKATPFFDGLADSNAQHRSWTTNRLEQVLAPLAGRRIAVWGLTYKAGTTTLRRSDAVALCHQLIERGASVAAHDPAVIARPAELDPRIELHDDPIAAATAADALVVATGWPAYREVSAASLFTALKRAVIVDASRFLGSTLGADLRFEYFSVGRGRQ